MLQSEGEGYHWRQVVISREGTVLWRMIDKTYGNPGALERKMLLKLAEMLTDDELARALAKGKEANSV